MTATHDNDDARLSEAAAAVAAEIARSDTKAGHLLSSFSLPLTVLIATVPGRDLPPTSSVLIKAGAIGMVLAMLIVLVVVAPQMSRASRGGWVYWASCTPDELKEDLRSSASRAEHTIHLSRIARRKFIGLLLAGIVTGASFITLAAALPALP
ncbi:Pycsar system effector family protein [Streptomyces sp. NPDC024089]|uniref:Pycsar system effector family protein n=1 Tax=Streptomyces sp. NPDC024089 TaxID=3154328 RepID=UPI00340DC816